MYEFNGREVIINLSGEPLTSEAPVAQPRFPDYRQFRYNFDIVTPPLQNPSEEDCATHGQLFNVLNIDGRIKVMEIARGAKTANK